MRLLENNLFVVVLELPFISLMVGVTDFIFLSDFFDSATVFDDDCVGISTIPFISRRICKSKESSLAETVTLSSWLFDGCENKGNKSETEEPPESFFLELELCDALDFENCSFLESCLEFFLRNGDFRVSEDSFLSVKQKSNSK